MVIPPTHEMSKRMKSNILLLITAIIWGSAFVAQKEGAHLGAFTMNGIRTFIGGLVLIPVIFLFRAKGIAQDSGTDNKDTQKKMAIIGGIICGIVLFVASTLQQYGINFTSAGKAGFITALYIVIVPIMSIVLGKKVRGIVWIAACFGIVGLYLLAMTSESFSLQIGDLMVLLCAFGFSLHIMVIDYFSPRCNGVVMSCIQFLVAGGIGIICMFLFEEPNLTDICNAWLPILYAGIGSCGIGYTFQIIAQKDAEPTTASMLLSLESVFSVIAGVLILSESMTMRQYAGCLAIFIAVVLCQLPSKEERLQVKGGKK